MAWQNVLVGYKVKYFDKDDLIPIGSVFIESVYVKIDGGMIYPSRNVISGYRFQIPVYEKKNVKTK